MTEKPLPLFKNLRLIDRFKLTGAAAVETVSAIALEDTRYSARRYPFYLAYMLYLVVPFPPIPGSRTLPTLCLLGWVKLGLTEGARRANLQVSKKFNHAALVEDHKDFIDADPKTAGGFRVKGGPLTVSSYQAAWRDTVEAHRIFVKRASDFFFK